jgi:hypothetical protein
MGPVMARFERVSKETGAHMMTIHHNGKDAAKGSRGWSGIRAHIDTEIELEDKKDTRVATITKQRELPGKGTEIFFKLEIVVMGKTKWGEDATTCVVVQDDSDRQGYVSKESDSLAGYRRHFEKAMKEFGRFDSRLDGFFINTEKWAEYAQTHPHKSDGARRTYLSKAKKALLMAGYIEEVENGYIATDHVTLSAAFMDLPKY